MTTLTPAHLPLLHEYVREHHGRATVRNIDGRAAICLAIADAPNVGQLYNEAHPCHALLTALANVEPHGRWSRGLLRLANAWDRDREKRAADETKAGEIIEEIKAIALKRS